jgi:hypothetical protein
MYSICLIEWAPSWLGDECLAGSRRSGVSNRCGLAKTSGPSPTWTQELANRLPNICQQNRNHNPRKVQSDGNCLFNSNLSDPETNRNPQLVKQPHNCDIGKCKPNRAPYHAKVNGIWFEVETYSAEGEPKQHAERGGYQRSLQKRG